MITGHIIIALLQLGTAFLQYLMHRSHIRKLKSIQILFDGKESNGDDKSENG